MVCRLHLLGAPQAYAGAEMEQTHTDLHAKFQPPIGWKLWPTEWEIFVDRLVELLVAAKNNKKEKYPEVGQKYADSWALQDSIKLWPNISADSLSFKPFKIYDDYLFYHLK